MNTSPKKNRFLVTLFTNIFIVFIVLLIIWRYDIFKGINMPAGATSLDSLLNKADTVEEVYHPFTNDVEGSDGELVEHSYYKLRYNEATEQADWVAYHLTDSMFSGKAERKNYFKSDPEVDTESAHRDDYKGTVFDKGHLMPAASCKFDQEAMNETFFMSNMSPQYKYFNRGIWRFIEAQVKEWTQDLGHLYVVSGPASFFPDSTIGANKVAIPSLYYKVILFKEGDQYESAAFLIKNEKSSLKPHQFLVSVDSVEKVSGLDFFWELPDALENKTENRISTYFSEEPNQ